ncbi:MAG: phosphate ABC transporter permease PstA [Gemmatimonadetes bacterium]|nr:phosphate ABC transporter permease PstA [Gemmatimonadota bacterium]
MSSPFSVPSRNLARRRIDGVVFRAVCGLMTSLGIILLFVLLWRIGREGAAWVDWQFITSFPSRHPEKAGILSGLVGTLWMALMTAGISVPVGVGAAIYLEEFATRNRFTRFMEVNIANLAGVPSIIYGMLGLTVFVRALGLNRSLLAGALTMSLLVLPVIIVASREAIRQVPSAFRHAAFALGASRWETVRHHVLPAAVPGILTGVILSLSRAIGETAPLVVIGAFAYVAFVPEGPMDDFTVLPIQIFNWAGRPQEEFHSLAAAGILVLLAVLLLLNATAVFIRHRSRRNRPW